MHMPCIEMRVTRLRNLALLVYGIICSRSGCLSVIVRHYPHGPRRHTHRLKRLHLSRLIMLIRSRSAECARVTQNGNDCDTGYVLLLH
jgi:hypothetical protein